MQAYTNIHRARDVAETLLALFEATPPDPITPESTGRQIADCLSKHGLLTFGGAYGSWRPARRPVPADRIDHASDRSD